MSGKPSLLDFVIGRSVNVVFGIGSSQTVLCITFKKRLVVSESLGWRSTAHFLEIEPIEFVHASLPLAHPLSKEQKLGFRLRSTGRSANHEGSLPGGHLN